MISKREKIKEVIKMLKFISSSDDEEIKKVTIELIIEMLEEIDC